MDDLLAALESYGELDAAPEAREQILGMSAAIIDRPLRTHRDLCEPLG